MDNLNVKIETIDEETEDTLHTEPKLSTSSIYGDAKSDPALAQERSSQTKYTITHAPEELNQNENDDICVGTSELNLPFVTNVKSIHNFQIEQTMEDVLNELQHEGILIIPSVQDLNKIPSIDDNLDQFQSFEDICVQSSEHINNIGMKEDDNQFENIHKDSKFEKKDSKVKLLLNEINKRIFADTGSIASNVKAECEICKYCRVIGNEIMYNHAQEPWPKDVRLFQPYEVEQILLPDNANCLAVQTFLKMCNLEYKVDPRPNAEAMSPTGKVPFIKCGAFIIAEMEPIVQFVGGKGITLTESMSVEDKADMRAYMTLVNNVLGNAEMYICWCDDETYREVTKTRYGSIYPWPLNHIQVWTKRSEELKRLKVLGWQQKTLEEVYNDVETCCQALTDRLDKHDFFFGSKFTELDALVYSHLFLILNIPLPAHLGMIVKKFDTLVKFCKRIDTEIMGRETDLTPRQYYKHTKRVAFRERPSSSRPKSVAKVHRDKILSETTLSIQV